MKVFGLGRASSATFTCQMEFRDEAQAELLNFKLKLSILLFVFVKWTKFGEFMIVV